MMSDLLHEVSRSILNPRDSAADLLARKFERNTLWGAMALVTVLSVLMAKLMVWIAPQQAALPPQFPSSPFMLAAAMAFGLILAVFGTHFVGRAFGGQGTFSGSLLVVVWVQIILVVLQVVQIVILVISATVAALLGIAIAGLGFWLYLNFVAVLHEFKSLFMVFVATILSTVGLLFGLSFLLAVLSAILGLEFRNV